MSILVGGNAPLVRAGSVGEAVFAYIDESESVRIQRVLSVNSDLLRTEQAIMRMRELMQKIVEGNSAVVAAYVDRRCAILRDAGDASVEALASRIVAEAGRQPTRAQINNAISVWQRAWLQRNERQLSGHSALLCTDYGLWRLWYSHYLPSSNLRGNQKRHGIAAGVGLRVFERARTQSVESALIEYRTTRSIVEQSLDIYVRMLSRLPDLEDLLNFFELHKVVLLSEIALAIVEGQVRSCL